jgi:hypothetical protein
MAGGGLHEEDELGVEAHRVQGYAAGEERDRRTDPGEEGALVGQAEPASGSSPDS